MPISLSLKSQMPFYYRCYLLPILAGLLYIVLSLKPVNRMFDEWVPHYYYNVVTRAFLIMIILFIVCRVLYLIWGEDNADEDEETQFGVLYFVIVFIIIHHYNIFIISCIYYYFLSLLLRPVPLVAMSELDTIFPQY